MFFSGFAIVTCGIYASDGSMVLNARLGVLERCMLRTLFGGVQKNDVWRIRMKHELAALTANSESRSGARWKNVIDILQHLHDSKITVNKQVGE